VRESRGERRGGTESEDSGIENNKAEGLEKVVASRFGAQLVVRLQSRLLCI